MAKVFLLDFVLCQHPATGHLASTLADCLLLLLKGLKCQHMAGEAIHSPLVSIRKVPQHVMGMALHRHTVLENLLGIDGSSKLLSFFYWCVSHL